LWLALASFIGCGGRSIGIGNEEGEAETGERGKDPQLSCLEACEEATTCARAPYECSFFCGEAENAAADAGCRSAYAALVRCLTHAEDPCAARAACITEVNAFGVCMLDYCGRQRSAPICGS
jgi:hypothetical protein